MIISKINNAIVDNPPIILIRGEKNKLAYLLNPEDRLEIIVPNFLWKGKPWKYLQSRPSLIEFIHPGLFYMINEGFFSDTSLLKKECPLYWCDGGSIASAFKEAKAFLENDPWYLEFYPFFPNGFKAVEDLVKKGLEFLQGNPINFSEFSRMFYDLPEYRGYRITKIREKEIIAVQEDIWGNNFNQSFSFSPNDPRIQGLKEGDFFVL